MKKADRQKVFDKYFGKCAYCGCKLQKGWHVDELIPVRRDRMVVRDEHGFPVYKFGKVQHKIVMLHPENLNINNQMPSCPSCNINKHSDSLEEFRSHISGFVVSLNRDSVQYKIAKRYGLVIETKKPIVFYFERVSVNVL